LVVDVGTLGQIDRVRPVRLTDIDLHVPVTLCDEGQAGRTSGYGVGRGAAVRIAAAGVHLLVASVLVFSRAIVSAGLRDAGPPDALGRRMVAV
jgi:hypothetical protein